MTTYEFWKDGKCGSFKSIRVKVWDSGFSIKCFGGTKRALVGRPFSEEFMRHDLITFCDNCEKRVVQKEMNPK